MISNLSMHSFLPKVERYKSNAQRIRVLSESWLKAFVYCPFCLHTSLSSFPNNHKAGDFLCGKCNNHFELKSSASSPKSKIVDGEYNTMISAIRNNKTPSFFLLSYDAAYSVHRLLVIPNLFISESVIEKRKPLSPTARRAGWTGCNILLTGIPEEGKISLIANGQIAKPVDVQRVLKKFSFLENTPPPMKGWTLDVLRCIEDLGHKSFSLDELYRYEKRLKALHPGNNNVLPKIRQQLQLLRDKGIIRFLGEGRYERL